MIVTSLALYLLAQSTTQTQPLPNPYSGTATPRTTQQVQRPRVARTRGGRGFIYGGGGQVQTVVEAPAPAVKEDPLKDLVISPVYEREKYTPRMITIP